MTASESEWGKKGERARKVNQKESGIFKPAFWSLKPSFKLMEVTHIYRKTGGSVTYFVHVTVYNFQGTNRPDDSMIIC